MIVKFNFNIKYPDIIFDIRIQGFPISEDEYLVEEFLVGAGLETIPVAVGPQVCLLH